MQAKSEEDKPQLPLTIGQQGIKLRDAKNHLTYLEKVSGVYYHVIPGVSGFPESRKRIGQKQRHLKRYLERNNLSMD